jgi:hypothetical protein
MVDQKVNSRVIHKMNERRVNKLGLSCELDVIESPIFRRSVRDALSKWLRSMEETEPEPITKCGHCGRDAKYVKNRARVVHTDFGMIRYRRAYYVCPHCFQHTCPLDERLNPYLSLNRLRNRIAAGETLRVNEMADAWGLGTIPCSGDVQSDSIRKASSFTTSWKVETDLLLRIQSA